MEREGTPRFLAASYRLGRHRLRLEAEVCPECEHIMIYPRDVCTRCRQITVDEHGQAKITISLEQPRKVSNLPDTQVPDGLTLD